MLLQQLEYLSALAREGHFGRAAAVCHVSQPALSAGIRKLETELGVQIVQRGHRFEGFTPEGKQVLLWAHRIIAEQEALRDELASIRGGLSGRLRIGAIPTALTVAPLLTNSLHQRHPMVTVSAGVVGRVVQKVASMTEPVAPPSSKVNRRSEHSYQPSSVQERDNTGWKDAAAGWWSTTGATAISDRRCHLLVSTGLMALICGDVVRPDASCRCQRGQA